MRSASRVILITAGVASLAGCTTTQEKAAWLQLNSARIRVSQEPLRLSGSNATVRVVSVTVVPGRTGARSAIVVTVHNTGSRPVSDLPLLVGASTAHGHRIHLNAAAGVSYFDNHVPAIAPRGSLRWVLTLHRRLPRGARPFARLGVAAPPTATRVLSLPLLRVSGRLTPHNRVVLTVVNPSGVPQYQLPVYALARGDRRVLAAGQATIGELDGGASAQLRLSLVGRSQRAALSFEAPPTTFK